MGVISLILIIAGAICFAIAAFVKTSSGRPAWGWLGALLVTLALLFNQVALVVKVDA